MTSVLPGIIASALYILSPCCQLFLCPFRSLVRRYHKEKFQCLRRYMFSVTYPPGMAWIVEVPVVNDILCTLLSIFQKFLRLSVGFIKFRQIHKEVTEH